MRTRAALLALLLLLLPAGSVLAEPSEVPADPGAAPAAPAEEPPVDWIEGPVEDADLGGVGTVQVPEGYLFVPQEEMAAFNELTGNLPAPQDVGALVAPEGWVAFFTFEESGYVKDDEAELDTEALLESLKESNERANEARLEAGMDSFSVVGWRTPPFYDPRTHNLTWALDYVDGEGHPSINHQVRLLGRRGVMSVIVAADSDQLPEALPKLESLLEGYAFAPGQRYAEYRTGDKVAEYGLAGLVAGGAVLAAAKTGLLAKLGKFGKFIFLAVAGAGAALWRKVKHLFGR